MHVLVDDTRTFGQVIIKDPRVAIQVLRRILKSIELIGWDNDMGYGYEFEGRVLIRQFLQDCKNAKHFPRVYIVTGNSVAREDMYKTLKEFGYEPTHDDDQSWSKAC